MYRITARKDYIQNIEKITSTKNSNSDNELFNFLNSFSHQDYYLYNLLKEKYTKFNDTSVEKPRVISFHGYLLNVNLFDIEKIL